MNRATDVTLQIPGMLRAYASGNGRLPFDGGTVRAALGELAASHPVLHRAIVDETGVVRRHVNVFVNASNIKDLQGLDSPLSPGDVVTIVPAVSGG